VLRHQLEIISRKKGKPRLRSEDKVLLAALSRQLPRDRWRSFVVRPETVLRCTVSSSLAGRAGVGERAPADLRPRCGSGSWSSA
jgi:hypothetical protein